MDTIWQPDLSAFPGPKYRALADALRAAIAEGVLKEGEKLPPVRDLAWRVGITPGTVARAYTILTEAGVLSAAVGRGTFVASKPVAEDIDSPIEVDVIPHGLNVPENAYDVNLLSPHLPAVGQTTLIKRVLSRIASEPPSGLMHYPNWDASGDARRAAARWLEPLPLGRLSAEDIVLTHGGQNAITLILAALLKGRKPTILVEELFYPGFRRAAELLRADVVPLAMDRHGIIPEALEEAASRTNATIFCTSPEVHNPTTVTTPDERRVAIADLARRFDLQILEDDCYAPAGDRGPTYRMLAPERGWYASSISKMLTPALRIGFAIAPVGRTTILRRAMEHSSFGIATPLTDLAAGLLGDPAIDKMADAVVDENNRYLRAAINALGGFDVRWREGVSFLWLVLPDGWRAGAFCRAAEERGVKLRASEDFTTRDAPAPHAVRLAVNAGVSLASFEAAMLRLRDLLEHPPRMISV